MRSRELGLLALIAVAVGMKQPPTSCPETSSHASVSSNGKHCVCNPGYTCVSSGPGNAKHCSHGYISKRDGFAIGGHKNLSGYRHNKCPACTCAATAIGHHRSVSQQDHTETVAETAATAVKDAKVIDVVEPQCSLPTPLGSLDVGFTLADIAPCGIDPGPIALETRDGGGDCPEDLTCVRCRASSDDQEALLIAEDVLAAFRNVTRQRARREWFAQAFGPASERSKDDPVHVIMADDGWYGDMALNWFAVASDRGIPGLVSGAVRSGLLFGIDDEIVRKATRSGIPAFTMREYDARIPAARQGRRWLGVKRWAWALQADLLGAGYSVAFFDADALLLRPLGPLLRDSKRHTVGHGWGFDSTQMKWTLRTSSVMQFLNIPPQVYGQADVLAQHAKEMNERVPDHGPLNTGVVFLRAGCRAVMLAETLLNLVGVQADDQYWFNHVLKSPHLAAVRVSIFSREHVASMSYTREGMRFDCHVAHVGEPVHDPVLPDSLTAVHMQVGHTNKQAAMESCGLWLLPTAPEAEVSLQ